MRAASARNTDCFSTDKRRTSSWMWLGSCFRIHTLMLTHCCLRSSPAKWYMSSIHLCSGQQLHDISGCWQSGLCLFVLAAPQQVLYVLGWKEGERQPDRESMYWQCRQTIKWPDTEKKLQFPCFHALARQSWPAAGCVCPDLQGVMYGVWGLNVKAAGQGTAMWSSLLKEKMAA